MPFVYVWPTGDIVQIFRIVRNFGAHFGNSLIFNLYRSEYGTIWRPVIGALAYLVTQVSKMLLIAGLVNLSTFWERVIDCIGLYYFLINHQKASVASVKILSMLLKIHCCMYTIYLFKFFISDMALGWSVAESVFTRLISFYLNARSLQFDWQHLINAGQANLSLVQNICFCSLLWYWNRKNNKAYLGLLIIYIVLISFIESYIVLQIGALLAFSLLTLLMSN